MKIIRTPQAMRACRERWRREGVTIGFVPTMGALHDGHRALIRAARLQCDALVVSIFVNPTQFAPTEDLAKYPRPIARDRRLCREEGVDVCFEPSVAAMYPSGFQTTVTVPEVARRWEGERRPHHFAGVATVVAKLFNMVQPSVSLFGQKDFQQAALIRRLIKDLNLDVRLIVHPTIRDEDGLALSSRNVYLSSEARALAPMFFQSLQAGADAIHRGDVKGTRIQAAMTKVIAAHSDITIDYLAVCDPETLEPVKIVEKKAVLLGAIRLGGVRLIDNLVVTAPRRSSR